MLGFFKKFFRFPGLRELPLKTSAVSFSLERLVRGVDNIRYDVYLSPDFRKSVGKIVTQLVAAHTRSEEILHLENTSNWIKEKDEFKQLCYEVMQDSINKAKLRHEIQIDYLLQTAIISFIIAEIRARFEKLIVQLKNRIREQEGSRRQEEAVRLKKELSDLQENRKTILRKAGREMFQYVTEVRNKDLKDMREANFSREAYLPDYIFSNPIFHLEDPDDDFFMIEEYDVLLGRRVEDPDNYATLISFIKEILTEMDIRHNKTSEKNSISQPDGGVSKLHSDGGVSKCNFDTPEYKASLQKEIEGWLNDTDNIALLFNYFETEQRYKSLKKQKAGQPEILELKNRCAIQKAFLNFVFGKFKKKKLSERVVAMYEMQPVYLEYCPPLVPQLILQYLISQKARKGLAARLKRLKTYYGKSFSMRPLRNIILKMEKVNTRTRKAYLIRFLEGLIRYHRDFQIFSTIKEAMDSINLATEEKIIGLSRANNTLYEFLLPHERESQVKPVISHVIVKADVRGSTDIVHKMKEKKLNPATHFSLNFFDPITEILPEYGAVKVCIEGDAYILAIYERENSPENWYSVARACGLAIQMVSIIRRYNVKNEKYQLPTLELGIGITYRDEAPTIFFDGDHQIMISSGINLADRLSGCSKSVRKKMAGNKEPFNLYVFQGVSDEAVAATSDDLFLRYNVNGIELDIGGFVKLSKEIDMKTVEISVSKKKRIFYTGKFPTVNGIYRRLLIREERIPRIDPDSLEVTGLTNRRYYEVCVNPGLYEHIKKMNL